MIVTVTLGPCYGRKYGITGGMDAVADLARSIFGRDATLRVEGNRVAVVRPVGEHGEGVVGRLRIAA
jgi:hypothetical protein